MTKINYYLISLFLLMFLSFSELNAQTGNSSIEGTITDAQTGEALIGAYIIIEGTSFGTATDFEGVYVLPNIPVGDYSFIISYIGYDDKVVTASVIAGAKTILDVKLPFSGQTLDAIVITAQARGQMNAINEQLNSLDIRNVVSAERIQELPDANAAETVGRISGVSVLRNGGEGNRVVIRGMSPKYNKITVEGISLAGAEADRGIDISSISPYSLDGIEVMKTATADKDADFIGGAINFKLRTADKGWNYDFVAQAGYNALKATSSDYMIVGSIGNRFLDNKLGIYVQGNIERRNRSANQLSASYDVRNNALIGQNNPVFNQRLTLTDAFRERSRNGLTVVMDYKIPDGIIHFKNLYNASGTNVKRYNQIFSTETRRHSYEGRIEQYDLTSISNILDIEKRMGAWKIDAKVSHSFAQNDIPTFLSFLFEQEAALASEAKDEAIPPIEVVNFTSIDDERTFFNRSSETADLTEERQLGTSLNLSYDFTLSKQINGNIKIGGKYRYKDRFFQRDVFGSDLKIGSGQSGNDVIINSFPFIADQVSLGNRLPFTLFSDTQFDHRDFLNGEYSMGAVPNLDLMARVLEVLRQNEDALQDGYFHFDRSSNTFDYSGNEYLTAGYIMADINIGQKIKLIPGVRYEKNKTVYTAVEGITNIAFAERSYNYFEREFTRENDFLLPMIHLKVSPTKWFNAIVAYSQTLSRPSYNQIAPRQDLWANTTTWNNFKLKPELSENFDLHLSFHENHLGLFTIGGFVKKIDNMIFASGKRVILDTSAYELPGDYQFRDIFTHINNPHQATVRGLELDWQTNFWYLPGALKGLVLNVNYTHIFSDAKYPFTRIENDAKFPWDPPIWSNIDTSYTAQLINQPDDIVNVQIGYDYKGFSARLSTLFQSKIFKRPNFWPELSNFADDYLRWDFSVKQKLPWYGMQIYCNVNNITGAKDRDLVQGASYDASIQHYGMTVDLGLRVKL